MNSKEFKLWLDGYFDAIGDNEPTKEQWKLIKEKVKDVVIERADIHYYPVWPTNPYWSGNNYILCGSYTSTGTTLEN